MLPAFISKIWRKFDTLPEARKPPTASGYTVFTRKFDRCVDVSELDDVLGPLNPEQLVSLFDAFSALQDGLAAWKVEATIKAMEKLAVLRRECPASDLADTSLTVLVDHSGSMKGHRLLLAAATVDILVDLLLPMGIAVEILGFTTSSWKGGQSRKAWVRAGKPPEPGRLCDLLHIVYRAGDKSPSWGRLGLEKMLRRDLPKENVDGEALEWAVSRAASLGKSNRLLAIVSDGAPVDDSTLSANSRPSILVDHLKEVVAEIARRDEVDLVAIGIGYRVDEYYPRSIRIDTPEDLGTVGIGLIIDRVIERLCRGKAAQ